MTHHLPKACTVSYKKLSYGANGVPYKLIKNTALHIVKYCISLIQSTLVIIVISDSYRIINILYEFSLFSLSLYSRFIIIQNVVPLTKLLTMGLK